MLNYFKIGGGVIPLPIPLETLTYILCWVVDRAIGTI